MDFYRLKGFLSKSSFYKILSKIYNYNGPKNHSLKEVLNTLNKSKSGIQFLQIGSNDGKTGDPIYEYVTGENWKGILVEPVPDVFDLLKDNYSQNQENLVFENIAVGPEEGQLTFYSLSKEFKESTNLPWANQLGSLNKDVILRHKHRFSNIEDYIVEIAVPVLNINNLLSKHRNFVDKIDLLHIDAEGYDYQILNSYKFNKESPSVIIYEHIHLLKKEKRTINKKLRQNGYSLYWDGKDTFGVKFG